jgi:glucokinase
MYAITPEQIVIGIDIGGTNIVVAAVSAEGDLLARTSAPTMPKWGPDDGVRRIVAMIREVQRAAGDGDLAGVGIGCTGPVNRLTGTIHNPYTLPTWDNFPLTSRLADVLQVPVVIENDAHAGALGEHWRGAGRGTRHLIYVTVGTGVGGGLILNGMLYTGATGTAGEIGHHSVNMNGPECYCGGRGCVEQYAAAPALTRSARDRMSSSDTLMALVDGDPGRINPKVLAEAARSGDPVARAVIDEGAIALAIGIANLAYILVPDIIVMGGGVMRSFDLFRPIIDDTLDRLNFPLGDLRVLRAALDTDAGVIGAARAVLDRCFVRHHDQARTRSS